MREQIVQLEPHDDVISARDKLSRAKTERVLVVFPEDPRARILQRQLDVLLLQREATRRQAQLALITRDPVVITHAKELGVPHFPSVKASRKTDWVTQKADLRRTERIHQLTPLTPELAEAATNDADPIQLPQTLSRGAAIGIGTAALTLLVILVVFVVPSATVIMRPAFDQVSVTTTVRAIPGSSDIDEAASTMPARLVGIELEGMTSVNTTGTASQPSEKARGVAVFTNLFPEQVTIPAGTVVTTSAAQPVRFVTLEDATLAAQIGDALEVGIEAVEPGFTGNLPSARINTVEGPLDNRIGVTNPEPTRGGDAIDVPAVATEDRERARAQLLQQLQQRAFAEMQTDPLIGLQETEFIPLETLRVVIVDTETYSAPSGQAAETLDLTMRVTIQGVAIDERLARQVIYARLAERVDAGFALQPDTLIFRTGEVTEINGNEVTFIMQAAGDIAAVIDENRVQRRLIGLPRAQAIQLLERDYPLEEETTIIQRPSFWPVMPALPLRINVQVEAP